MPIWWLGAFYCGGIFSCSTARVLGAAPFLWPSASVYVHGGGQMNDFLFSTLLVRTDIIY